MPFSHFSRQRITFPLKQVMPDPADIADGGGVSANGGIQNGVIGTIPSEPSTNLEVGNDFVAERPLINQVGTYRFNWTRMLSHQLGAPYPGSAGGTPPTIASYFRRLRFGTGYMTMERIDSGADLILAVNTSGDGTLDAQPMYPVNTGKLPLIVNYIRLNPHEHTWSQFLCSVALFKSHPRRRSFLLWPGKKVTFKFTPRRFSPPSYIAETLRDWSNLVGTETDMYHRAEIPGRSHRLGWIPTGMVCAENFNTVVPIDDNSVGGLTPGSVISVLSPTIAFMFQHYAYGYNTYPGRGGLGLPVTTPLGGAPSVGPLIRRSEFTTVTFTDMVQNSTATDGSTNVNGSNAVGQIIQVSPYDGSSVSHNVNELFDPPRITGIFKTVDQAHPLWRFPDGASATTFAVTQVPYDLEAAPVPDVSAVPVPAAGTVP